MSVEPPVQSIYENGEYLQRNPEWHVEESPWKAQQLLRMLSRNDLRPQTVCEVGCGAGEVLRRLQMSLGTTCEFCGYDISPQAMDLCQPRANSRLHFKLASAEDIADWTFDLVLVLDVIEHLDDYTTFLRTIRSKARFTIFHIPLDLSVQTILRGSGLLHVRRAYGHLHYFTRETALGAVQDAGYEVIDWFYTPRAIDAPTVEPRRRLVRWPRKLLFSLHQDLAARTLGGFSLMVLAASASTHPAPV